MLKSHENKWSLMALLHAASFDIQAHGVETLRTHTQLMCVGPERQ